MTATDAYGNPGTVAAGELVESAWGNAAATHVVRSGPISARPASAHNGATWYSTDDKRTYVFHATNGWVVSDWNQAWGLRSVTSLAADAGNGTSSGIVSILSSAAFYGRPWVAGRRHRVTMLFCFSTNTAGDLFQFSLLKGGGTAGAALVMVGSSLPATFVDHRVISAVDSVGDQTTWTFCVNRTSGGAGNIAIKGTASYSNQLTVEDVGPVTPI